MKRSFTYLQAGLIMVLAAIISFTAGKLIANLTSGSSDNSLTQLSLKYPAYSVPRMPIPVAKQYYISFVEDISAAKVGENLSAQFSGDTLQIGYPEDYPDGMKVQLLPN